MTQKKRLPKRGRQPLHDTCLVLESNIDDTSPELLGNLSSMLLEQGALDVFLTPVQMKKLRPGVLLTVLCKPRLKPKLLDLIFRETTTFGVREHTVRRTILARRHKEVRTPYGKVRIKIGTWRGDDVTCSPEYEDCAARAKERRVPVRAVYEAAAKLASRSS